MRWYRIKKAELDEKGRTIKANLRDSDIVVRQKAARLARQLHPAQPELLPILAHVAGTDSSQMVRREVIRSLGALAQSGDGAAMYHRQVVDQLFRILTERTAPEVKVEAAWAIGKYGDVAREYVPRLRALIEERGESGANFPALRQAIQTAIEELETTPDMADIPLITDNVKLNPQLFKLSQGEEKTPDGKWVRSGKPPYLVPGTKLKLRFPGTTSNEFSFGTLSRIDYAEEVQEINALFRVDNNALFRKATEAEVNESSEAKRRGGGGKVLVDGVNYGLIQIDGVRYYVKKEQKNLRKPKLIVTLKNGQEIKIDPLDPRVEAWIFKDPEDVPLDKYRGIWVKTSDPMARKVGDEDSDGTVTGLLIKQQGDECIIKIMKGAVPWTVRVPASSCKPSKNAPVWGTPFAANRSALGWGDAVSFSGDPDQHYIVETVGPNAGMVTIRPLRAKRGAGNIEVPLDEVKYVGRFEYPSRVVTDPHFSSPTFKPAPSKGPAPDVE